MTTNKQRNNHNKQISKQTNKQTKTVDHNNKETKKQTNKQSQQTNKPYTSILSIGTVGSSYIADIALDDIIITNNGACQESTICDFETDDCGWENVKNGDKHDWLRNHGHTSSRLVTNAMLTT